MPTEEKIGIRRDRFPITMLEDRIIDDERISGPDLLVFLALSRHANPERECWPSLDRIRRLARCSRSTASESLARLEAAGYLKKTLRTREDGGRTSSLYQILITPPVRQEYRGGTPEVQPPVRQEYSKDLHSEGDTSKEREDSPSASLPPFRNRLQAATRKILGRETEFAQKAEALLLSGEDPDVILEAWSVMLRERPAGAAYFDKDYPTRWRPKVRHREKAPEGQACPECELHGGLHVLGCSRAPGRAARLERERQGALEQNAALIGERETAEALT